MAMLDIAYPETIDEEVLTSAIVADRRPNRPSPISASLTLGWRAMLKIKHVPFQMLDVTMFPILMTVMFTYIFGGALAGSAKEYIQQLLPGILVMTVSMVSMYTALSLNTDFAKGIFDRFRSLPFWRPAVLIGALLGDMFRYGIAAVVVIVVGMAIGFRPDAGFSGIVLSLGLLLVFAFSLSWIWTTLGLLMDDSESVMMVSQMTTFPLTFLSNVFVDPSTMPEWLQGFVDINPVSLVATAVRGLMNDTVTAEQIIAVFISCAIMLAIFVPITLRLYNTKNTT